MRWSFILYLVFVCYEGINQRKDLLSFLSNTFHHSPSTDSRLHNSHTQIDVFIHTCAYDSGRVSVWPLRRPTAGYFTYTVCKFLPRPGPKRFLSGAYFDKCLLIRPMCIQTLFASVQMWLCLCSLLTRERPDMCGMLSVTPFQTRPKTANPSFHSSPTCIKDQSTYCL